MFQLFNKGLFKQFIKFFIFIITLSSCSVATADLPNGLYAKIKTDKGTILIQLEMERAPMTVCSFVGLAEGTIENSVTDKAYFDGLTFHRVEDWVVQGGDPTGTGTGGPGYEFYNEIDPALSYSESGIVGMANAGPHTNGSQFFIVLKESKFLDGNYTIFGKVIEGMDIVNRLEAGDQMKKVSILRIGEKAEAFVADSENFEELRIALGEEIERQKFEAQRAIRSEIETRFPDSELSESGIYYTIEREGTGNKPEIGQMVTVHYRGLLMDGFEFDSSYDRDEPIVFPVGEGRVISGWDETLLDMKAGERRTVVIPPELGYGDRGAGGVIPPESWLIFNVELLSIGDE